MAGQNIFNLKETSKFISKQSSYSQLSGVRSPKIKMSDNIPFEILEEVMKRLPIKSLIQFRSVSKQWKSLIDGSEFIANYHHTQPQHHLLVRYPDPQDGSNRKHVSILDDDTFPQQKFPVTVPVSIQQLRSTVLNMQSPTIQGSSQGLYCFYNFAITNIAVIWNPAIRKSVDIAVPNVPDSMSYYTVLGFGDLPDIAVPNLLDSMPVLGFGVCPHTNDPKLVKATLPSSHKLNGFVDGFWEVEVFTLSYGVWRSPKSSNLPSNMTALIEYDNVIIDGFIYWHAYDTNIVDGKREWFYLIMSFDLTSEEFTKIYLPDSLSISATEDDTSLSKLRDSLVVLQSSYEEEVLLNCSVWMMENGDPKSFTKIFTITPPDASIRMVLGFRKSGETIIEVIEEEHDALSVYEHYSEQTNCIGISAQEFLIYVNCYMETLLLLDH